MKIKNNDLCSVQQNNIKPYRQGTMASKQLLVYFNAHRVLYTNYIESD